jgi:radical SAM superfamily enzyme YgiQ (UPF0313 family)
MKPGILHEWAGGLLGSETGAVHKDPGGKLNICLAFPNDYSLGMSNLGFLGVYTILNARQDVVCERAFLPSREVARAFERGRTPLFALESGRPLAEFDVLAFSVSFENDYPGILSILKLANIPLLARERRGQGRWPIIAAGGVCMTSNPEPLAPFLDVAFVGEAEGMLDRFVDALMGSPDREAALARAMGVGGVYLPAMYEERYDPGTSRLMGRVAHGGAPGRITRQFAPDISARPMGHEIVSAKAEFAGMRLVELQRGCPWACAFCLAGHVYDPPRKKDVAVARAEIASARAAGHRVGLIGPSLADYPHCADLLEGGGVELSVTSLRANMKSARLIESLAGRPSVSIAPEAGSERLRRLIRKKVTHADVLDAARLIFSTRVKRLRLYFMIGLPTETDEDIDELAALALELAAMATGAKWTGRIQLTVSVFVPKPHTPFARMPMPAPGTIKDRLKRIKKAVGQRADVRHDPVKSAYEQCLYARGDRRVGRVLEAMAREGLDYRAAARSVGLDADEYTLREIPPDEPLPWGFIDLGIKPDARRCDE